MAHVICAWNYFSADAAVRSCAYDNSNSCSMSVLFVALILSIAFSVWWIWIAHCVMLYFTINSILVIASLIVSCFIQCNLCIRCVYLSNPLDTLLLVDLLLFELTCCSKSEYKRSLDDMFSCVSSLNCMFNKKITWINDKK